eukprot:11157535-Lingulodinium_polyedra.AAC.1
MLGNCSGAAWVLLACCSTRYTDRPPPQNALSRTPCIQQRLLHAWNARTCGLRAATMTRGRFNRITA